MPALFNTALAIAPGRLEIERGNRVSPSTTRPQTLARTPLEWSLYLETFRGTDEWFLAPEVLDWSNVSFQLDGNDSKATLVVRGLDERKLTSGGQLGEEHLVDVLSKLHPDRRIRIARAQGMDAPLILFQGYPQSRQANWSERHQAITCSAIYEAQEIARTHRLGQIIGQLRPRDPGLTELGDWARIDSLAAIFNPKGKPNRSKERSEIAGWRVYAFAEEDRKESTFWNFADALRYVALFYMHIPDIGIRVLDFLRDTDDFAGENPAPDSGDPFKRKMLARVTGVSVQSMSADQALAALCSAADLHYEYAVRQETPPYFLRVFAALEEESEEEETRERSMVAPMVADIPRDAPFTNYAGMTPGDIAQRNEARKAALNIDTRAVTEAIFLGGAQEFEVTVLLRPGWLPHAKLDSGRVDENWKYWEALLGLPDQVNEWEREELNLPAAVYHRRHPDFASLSDVLRRWVFPDDLFYLGEDLASSPYARIDGPWYDWKLWSPFVESGVEGEAKKSIWIDAKLGGSIPTAAAEKWVPRPRAFGETIGRENFETTSRSPLVWFNFVARDPQEALADDHWVRYSGTPVIDKRRAAIWLGDDNLLTSRALLTDPDDELSSMIRAYLEGRFFVAVTATIRGDYRINYTTGARGSTLTRSRAALIDLSYEKVRYRYRVQNLNFPMIWNHQETDPAFEERDDTAAFIRYTDDKVKEIGRDKVAGSWMAPYIKTDVRLGDSFSGCEGMGIAFRAYPACVGIEYGKDPQAGYSTTYHLTDLRHAPEVGSE